MFEALFNFKYLLTVLIILVVLYIIKLILNIFIFKKANINPMLGLVPIYSDYIYIKIAKLSNFYFILYFIPIANLIASIRVKYEISKIYGFGTGVTLIYFFIPIVGAMILAFKGNYTEKIEESEKVTQANEALEMEIDPFRDFKPVLNENAVSFEEGVVAYDDASNNINPDDIKLDTKEIESEVKEEVKEEVQPEEPTYVPNIPSVSLEEEVVAYDKPEKPKVTKTEVVVRKDEEFEELPEPETIVIPTGGVDNLSIPDGINSLVDTEKNESQKTSVKPQKKVCPKCHTQLDSDATVCFMCGTNL